MWKTCHQTAKKPYGTAVYRLGLKIGQLNYIYISNSCVIPLKNCQLTAGMTRVKSPGVYKLMLNFHFSWNTAAFDRAAWYRYGPFQQGILDLPGGPRIAMVD